MNNTLYLEVHRYIGRKINRMNHTCGMITHSTPRMSFQVDPPDKGDSSANAERCVWKYLDDTFPEPLLSLCPFNPLVRRKSAHKLSPGSVTRHVNTRFCCIWYRVPGNVIFNTINSHILYQNRIYTSTKYIRNVRWGAHTRCGAHTYTCTHAVVNAFRAKQGNKNSWLPWL